MKIVVIQILLILALVLLMARLVRSQGQRTQAVRRLGLLAFVALAVLSILFPGLWNRLAQLVGVGRGTDMILYGLVVVFLSFVVTSYLRFRNLEDRYTKLARNIALDRVRAQGDAHPVAGSSPSMVDDPKGPSDDPLADGPDRTG